MAQHRQAPAYQEYAASMIARREYRLMKLAARGLLYSIRLECWINRTVPAAPELLARVLGYRLDEITTALEEVAPFLARDGENFVMPDLEDYRAHLSGIRERQAAGGKRGAEKTNGMRSGNSSGNSSALAQVTRRVSCGSVDQFNSVQSNQGKSPSHQRNQQGGEGIGGGDDF